MMILKLHTVCILFVISLKLIENCVYCCRYVSKEKLDCSYDSLVHLPSFNKNLKSLNISHNTIVHLTKDNFYRLVSNTEQEFTSSNITGTKFINRLPFGGHSQLEELDLSWNLIAYVHPDTFTYSTKLERLSLAHNTELKLQPNALFLIGKSVKVLYLSYCNITEIGKRMFKNGAHNLRELHLDHNAITNVHDDALIMFKALELLDLRNNKLILFGIGVVLPLKKLHFLKLEGNPFYCSCMTQELHYWSVFDGVELGNVTCRISHQDIPWSEVLESKQCGTRHARFRRNAVGNSSSDTKESDKGSKIALIVIGVVAAVVVLVFLCACLLDNNHECMEAAGCLFVCHHCYQ